MKLENFWCWDPSGDYIHAAGTCMPLRMDPLPTRLTTHGSVCWYENYMQR